MKNTFINRLKFAREFWFKVFVCFTLFDNTISSITMPSISTSFYTFCFSGASKLMICVLVIVLEKLCYFNRITLMTVSFVIGNNSIGLGSSIWNLIVVLKEALSYLSLSSNQSHNSYKLLM